MFSTVSQAAQAPAPTSRSVKALKDMGPECAIIEVEVLKDYRPKSTDSMPCESLAGIPADLVCRFAVMYNEHHHARKNKRWACVGMNGCLFFLNGIQPEDRPSDPAAYPPAAEVNLTPIEALERMEKANSERMRLAQVPRRWTIALRPLIAAEGMVTACLR